MTEVVEKNSASWNGHAESFNLCKSLRKVGDMKSIKSLQSRYKDGVHRLDTAECYWMERWIHALLLHHQGGLEKNQVVAGVDVIKTIV
ncbi:hypothetical protein XELAEV_18023918mg [Xenopus laevis]|uniref:Uncharacterized protein n=1 Tax=Xenopus laevis TaxID=8355 RepID=A0A974D7L4_XENLA|nr:hypothetical protein XELAEV_18023918mg [Xenopus laevis]